VPPPLSANGNDYLSFSYAIDVAALTTIFLSPETRLSSLSFVHFVRLWLNLEEPEFPFLALASSFRLDSGANLEHVLLCGLLSPLY
jgi:hypothetical protein